MTIKLSEAIRNGPEIKQIQERYIEQDEHGNIIGACALGRVWLATHTPSPEFLAMMYLSQAEIICKDIRADFPQLIEHNGQVGNLHQFLTEYNDSDEKPSFEQIAEMLESLGL